MKKTKIVDSHHKVLVHWAAYRKKLGFAPRLFSLDHHTDTSQPFRNYVGRLIKEQDSGLKSQDKPDQQLKNQNKKFKDLQNALLKSVKFANEDSVVKAVSYLSNDEHIITAIKTNVISSALIVAHNARLTDLRTYLDHKVMCFPVPEVSKVKNKACYEYDKVIDSVFLDQAITSFGQTLKLTNEYLSFSKPFILDIDLDYFNTLKSTYPDDSSTFQFLVKNAGLITIATEPEYVQRCSIEKGLSSEIILNSIAKLF